MAEDGLHYFGRYVVFKAAGGEGVAEGVRRYVFERDTIFIYGSDDFIQFVSDGGVPVGTAVFIGEDQVFHTGGFGPGVFV